MSAILRTPAAPSRGRRVLRSVPAAVAALVIALAVVVLVPPSPARAAAAPDVSASCAAVDARFGAYTDKAEVSVVIDGELQTDGENAGWYLFRSSFTGRYVFEPDAAHTYSVSVNSFAADSDGRAFTPGKGGDMHIDGTTIPCTGVQVLAAASSCTGENRADKQQISLEISRLRAGVTYLTEVIDEAGSVVTHFQFRTAPVASKTFSGLKAGETYLVRVTDESNDVLSGAVSVAVAGCAGEMSLEGTEAECVGSEGAITTVLDGLVAGRHYTASLSPGTQTVAIDGTSSDGTLRFGGLKPSTSYTVTVSDDDAARAVRTTSTTPACASGAESRGSSAGRGADAAVSPVAAAFYPRVIASPPAVAAATVTTTLDGVASDAAGPGDDAAPYAAGGTAAGDGAGQVEASAASSWIGWVAAGVILLIGAALAIVLARRRRAA